MLPLAAAICLSGARGSLFRAPAPVQAPVTLYSGWPAAMPAVSGAYINNRAIRTDFSTPRDQSNGGGRGGRGGDRGGRGGRGGSTNRGGFGDFQGKKVSFD
jgi:hypothetical protein